MNNKTGIEEGTTINNNPNNNLNTTHLLIIILGATAIIGEIGTIILIYQQNLDIAVITGLLTFTGNITGGLIGYLGAYNQNNPKDGEEYANDEPVDEIQPDEEVVEVNTDVQHTTQGQPHTSQEKQ